MFYTVADLSWPNRSVEVSVGKEEGKGLQNKGECVFERCLI